MSGFNARAFAALLAAQVGAASVASAARAEHITKGPQITETVPTLTYEEAQTLLLKGANDQAKAMEAAANARTPAQKNAAKNLHIQADGEIGRARAVLNQGNGNPFNFSWFNPLAAFQSLFPSTTTPEPAKAAPAAKAQATPAPTRQGAAPTADTAPTTQPPRSAEETLPNDGALQPVGGPVETAPAASLADSRTQMDRADTFFRMTQMRAAASKNAFNNSLKADYAQKAKDKAEMTGKLEEAQKELAAQKNKNKGLTIAYQYLKTQYADLARWDTLLKNWTFGIIIAAAAVTGIAVMAGAGADARTKAKGMYTSAAAYMGSLMGKKRKSEGEEEDPLNPENFEPKEPKDKKEPAAPEASETPNDTKAPEISPYPPVVDSKEWNVTEIKLPNGEILSWIIQPPNSLAPFIVSKKNGTIHHNGKQVAERQNKSVKGNKNKTVDVIKLKDGEYQIHLGDGYRHVLNMKGLETDEPHSNKYVPSSTRPIPHIQAAKPEASAAAPEDLSVDADKSLNKPVPQKYAFNQEYTSNTDPFSKYYVLKPTTITPLATAESVSNGAGVPASVVPPQAAEVDTDSRFSYIPKLNKEENLLAAAWIAQTEKEHKAKQVAGLIPDEDQRFLITPELNAQEEALSKAWKKHVSRPVKPRIRAKTIKKNNG